MILKIDGASKTYTSGTRKVHALADVSLQLAAGQFAAVRGASGSGKSTLLMIAGALLRPDKGSVELDGKDPYRLSTAERARHRAESVGFVFQQFHLVPYLTVADNVLAPSLAARHPANRQRATELIDRFNLTERATHFPAELSTGERQRTAMARALLNGPRLLLADEPTGNLDPDNAQVILDHLAEFAGAGGAVLMVTHEQWVADHATRIIEMDAGRIANEVESEGV